MSSRPAHSTQGFSGQLGLRSETQYPKERTQNELPSPEHCASDRCWPSLQSEVLQTEISGSLQSVMLQTGISSSLQSGVLQTGISGSLQLDTSDRY